MARSTLVSAPRSVCAVLVSSVPDRAHALGPVVYTPPVDAPVVDGFRPPPTPYGPGNRGLEYALADVTPVRAAGDGEVIFAGYGRRHAARHDPSRRRAAHQLQLPDRGHGRRAAPGAPGPGHRAGARSPALRCARSRRTRTSTRRCCSPASLRTRARLVPGVEEGQGPARERRASGTSCASWSSGPRTVSPLVLHYAVELRPEVRLSHVVERLAQAHRTAAALHALPTPRRGPIGWSSDRRARRRSRVDGDAAARSTVSTRRRSASRRGDVLRFSYDGGRVPDDSDGDSFAVDRRPPVRGARHPARPRRGGRPTRRAAASQVAAAAPGVPIDVIGHSQGGVVARLAISNWPRPRVALPAEVVEPRDPRRTPRRRRSRDRRRRRGRAYRSRRGPCSTLRATAPTPSRSTS